jgi:plastin-1
MHLVGIQGADIVDGRPKLVLGLVWQLMRMHITQTLSKAGGKAGHQISDTEMVKWANATAAKGGAKRTIRSFKDPSLTTGVFVLDLLEGLRPGVVDPALVVDINESGDYEERRQNAKLAISIARKLGATIFVVPEDIVDVRARLVRRFVS